MNIGSNLIKNALIKSHEENSPKLVAKAASKYIFITLPQIRLIKLNTSNFLTELMLM